MGHASNLDTFLTLHKDQFLSSGIPELYWNTLYEKLHSQIFDAGENFQLLQISYDEERDDHEPAWALQATSDMKKSDSKHIYLIDHMWTFRVGDAKNQLLHYDAVRSRLCNMLGLADDLPKEEVVAKVFDQIWKLCCTYTIGNAQEIEDRLPVWYVMDEIGTAVMHADTPNCRVVPFIHVDAQITYSLLFPLTDIDKEEFMYTDLAEGIDHNQRAAMLLPWVPHSFEGIPFDPEVPSREYYLSGHIKETLPKLSLLQEIPQKERYEVYTEYALIKEYLTDNRFTVVNNKQEADILWYTTHFRDFEELSDTPEKYVNQFPFEYVLTVKDLFCLTCRKFGRVLPTWFPITYNLATETSNFVSYFQHRNKNNLDNYWIVKPYNLARSLDIHITDNINYIMRLPATGPKIAQKYISNPVLFYRPECEGRVKFDIRYVILLQSVKPLKVYVYKEFFLRFANKPFELKDFHIYEKHFTVMNYEKNVNMKHMTCEEFRMKWQEQFSNFAWNKIEELILDMIKQIFECAIKDEPPCGIAASPQSRAVYAADLMLEWNNSGEIQPKILEINWTPDCKRACQYYPDFYNQIFSLLFLNELSDAFFEI